jgi:hypothetical protein
MLVAYPFRCAASGDAHPEPEAILKRELRKGHPVVLIW